jgi:hypothetical protein
MGIIGYLPLANVMWGLAFLLLIPLFVGSMMLYAAIKTRNPEKHKKMGKMVLVYTIVIFLVAGGFVSYTNIIFLALGIAGGLLAWKGK